jgi:hypothetical protein
MCCVAKIRIIRLHLFINVTSIYSFLPIYYFSGHECVGCGNKYALKTSLKFHLDRCVMHVEVHCNKCRENKTFYNRCRYIEHASSHDQPPAILFSDIQVRVCVAVAVCNLV